MQTFLHLTLPIEDSRVATVVFFYCPYAGVIACGVRETSGHSRLCEFATCEMMDASVVTRDGGLLVGNRERNSRRKLRDYVGVFFKKVKGNVNGTSAYSAVPACVPRCPGGVGVLPEDNRIGLGERNAGDGPAPGVALREYRASPADASRAAIIAQIVLMHARHMRRAEDYARRRQLSASLTEVQMAQHLLRQFGLVRTRTGEIVPSRQA